jgi:hypothetical protein
MIDLNEGVNLIVGLLVKALFLLVVGLGIIVVRQTTLMDRVINIPVGGWFKALSWLFFLLSVVSALMAIILI